MPGAEHLVYYHLITEGTCVATVVGTDPLPLAAGEVVLLPHGDPHVMASAPDVTAVPAWEVYSPPPPGEVVGLRCGGGGEVTASSVASSPARRDPATRCSIRCRRSCA